jgi:hypothetical protein
MLPCRRTQCGGALVLALAAEMTRVLPVPEPAARSQSSTRPSPYQSVDASELPPRFEKDPRGAGFGLPHYLGIRGLFPRSTTV